jgi:hypothetical protein
MTNQQNIKLNNHQPNYYKNDHHSTINASLKRIILLNHIKKAVNNFDRSYDNTVVDTYAFYKVITSNEIINDLYNFINSDDNKSINNITVYSKILTDYIIEEIKTIYNHNNHTLFDSYSYYEYVYKLINIIIDNN